MECGRVGPWDRDVSRGNWSLGKGRVREVSTADQCTHSERARASVHISKFYLKVFYALT